MTNTEKMAWVRILKKHIAHLKRHGVAPRIIMTHEAALRSLGGAS